MSFLDSLLLGIAIFDGAVVSLLCLVALLNWAIERFQPKATDATMLKPYQPIDPVTSHLLRQIPQ